MNTSTHAYLMTNETQADLNILYEVTIIYIFTIWYFISNNYVF